MGSERSHARLAGEHITVVASTHIRRMPRVSKSNRFPFSGRRLFFLAAMLFLVGGSKGEASDLASRLEPVARSEGATILPQQNQSVLLAFTTPEGRWEGTLIVGNDAPYWDVPRATTNSLYFTAQAHLPGIAISERLIHLAHDIAARDDGSFGVRHPPQPWAPPWPLWLMAISGWTLLGILLLVRRCPVQLNIKLPHLVPAAIQSTIFAYWWTYWPAAGVQIATFPPEILLAYAVDGILAVVWLREWKVGFGPVPIVLSSNLFTAPGPWTALVIILVAFLTRMFVVRNGKHVLNPSAAGLTAGLLLTVLLPGIFQAGGVFSKLSIPPNIAELILLLALIPQARFRIALATVGTAVGLMNASHLFAEVPGLAMPGTLIMLVLFVTDPATIPRTPVGLLAYGYFIGMGVGVTGFATHHLGVGDDRLVKVLPVPFANALVPTFDALGAAAARRWRLAVLQPRWNLLHIAVWWALAIPPLVREKPRQFDAATHWTYRTPLIAFGADDVPRCENNPTFCRPFTFGGELSLWLERWRQPAPRT